MSIQDQSENHFDESSYQQTEITEIGVVGCKNIVKIQEEDDDDDVEVEDSKLETKSLVFNNNIV